MFYLVGDFETRSEAEITEVGLHNYAIHPTTRALMFGWRIVQDLNDKPPVEMWEPKLRPGQDRSDYQLPAELIAALSDPHVPIIAYNSAFERYIFQYVLGIIIPACRFQDPQPSARYLSLPKSLDDVGMILGLPMELRKDKRGVELMKIFSFPQTRKKKDGGGTYFIEPEDLPKEWEEYKEYCRQDVRAEQEVARREMMLGVFPLPDHERAIWLFDQKVNDRGVPTDKGFVEKALKIASRDKQDQQSEQNRKTGLANANSRDQLLPWVRERGYPLGNLRKQNVELVLKDPEVILTEECRDVLTARLEASSTSYKKLESILLNISPDGFLRNQFIFMGSSRCGRWSGNAVQLHNFARPDATFEDMDNVCKARQIIYDEDYKYLKTAFTDKNGKYYSPLMIVKNIIRTVFVAPEGQRFNVCDLNAIETRVGAWLAGCQPLLDVFENNRDPYLDFATKMYGIPYEKLWADYKGKNGREAQIAAKRMRQVAKPGVLGAIYRMGGGIWSKDKNGDRYKTGLFGYAEGMGIDMTQEQAYEVVKIFRNAYPEICGNGYSGNMKGIWVQIEEAIADVLNGERTIRTLGPGQDFRGAVTIDKIPIDGRDPMLRIQLPSGRYLHYMDARMRNERMPWKRTNRETGEEEDAYRPAFTYYSQDQETHMWVKIVAHGGHTFENIVQGIARDVLADKLLEFEAVGLAVALHVHDEGACLTPDDPFAPGIIQQEAIMGQPVSWAPTLPLGSAGFEGFFYHKE